MLPTAGSGAATVCKSVAAMRAERAESSAGLAALDGVIAVFALNTQR